MKTASQLRRDNIAEYILYMWQIEDLIRANKLDIDLIATNIIDRYQNLPDDDRQAMRSWYESLIDMMRSENVQTSGHLQINRNVLASVADLHSRLLADPRFEDYKAEFYRTLPFIVELRSRAGEAPAGEIETCLNALYGMLMLRLQGKEISDATKRAIDQISRFMALLVNYFAKDEAGELFKPAD
ncbi:MAG: DUF4924 family protein [Muribaculaceae bacterium]|nr:DUF4924 family protein [Muribaculaceae bacterium]